MSLAPEFPAPIRFGGRLRFDQHEHENYKRALAGLPAVARGEAEPIRFVDASAVRRPRNRPADARPARPRAHPTATANPNDVADIRRQIIALERQIIRTHQGQRAGQGVALGTSERSAHRGARLRTLQVALIG
jgi:hypothetical protein